MIAVFKTGGKQYIVRAGQVLKVEKINGSKGESHTFNEVLAINENSKNIIGSPLVKDAQIRTKIIDQIRGKKIIVFKKKEERIIVLPRATDKI